jgi:hypothetical protein
MKRRLLIATLLVAACGGPAGQPTSPPAPPPLPTGGAANPTGGASTPSTAPGNGSAGGTQIVFEDGGRSTILPNVALCLVAPDRVEISASAAGGTAGLTVSWRADQPPQQTSIVWTDLASAATYVAGPDVSADSPPQVAVSGHTVEILAELHDPALGRPSRNVRITASCPDATVDPTGPPDDPSVSGHGSVTVGGMTYEFDIAEQCDIGDGRIGVNLSDAEGNILSVVAIGPTAFMTMSVDGEQWLAGLTGTPMEFVISGSSATWSGTLAQADTSNQSPASLEVTCGG